MKVIKECPRIKKGERWRKEILREVERIVERVRREGEKALRDFTYKFDGIEIKNFRVEEKEMERARERVKKEEVQALEEVIERIKSFAENQKKSLKNWESGNVIKVGERWVPLRRVGIYVPGGKSPLVSTLLMAGVPARVAGVKELVVATPPSQDGGIDSRLLYACLRLNIREVYRIGGAQAIAALALGTENISPVEKIVGPGNIYVTLAKKILYGEVGIDMLAGPSEAVIIADEGMNPEFIVLDLLSQIEHGEGGMFLFLTHSYTLAQEVLARLKEEIGERRELREAWEKNGGIYVFPTIEEAIEFSNSLAPEHLVLGVSNPGDFLDKVRTSGTLLLGYYSPISLGDFYAGPNHILPTGGAGIFSSSLSVRDFMRCINLIQAQKEGLEKAYPFILTFSRIEGLPLHAKEVEVRIKEEKR